MHPIARARVAKRTLVKAKAKVAFWTVRKSLGSSCLYELTRGNTKGMLIPELAENLPSEFEARMQRAESLALGTAHRFDPRWMLPATFAICVDSHGRRLEYDSRTMLIG